jgi:adenine-specific DNA-methyltransferase
MPTPREKFQELLRKLFQFDCAELDFGIYRIMNQKRAVIDRFIEKDLLDGVAAELSSGALAQESNLAQEFADITAQVKGYLGEQALDAEGNLDPQYHYTTLGKQYLELRERVGKAKSSPELEAEIFNHLYTFFSRYYDNGDFMSLRRYSKRDKYAIPYNGEEVHLHWANSDQYYIKTGENFTDYSYKHDGWTVRFRLRNADVEQDNVKGAKRFFIPRSGDLAFDDTAKTVTLPFEFRPLEGDEEIRYGTGNKSEGENGAAGNGNGKEKDKKKGQDRILAGALAIVTEVARKHPSALAALMTTKREDSDGNPVSLIEHHLRAYTRANTSDFFVHRDLQGFMERELDFYLKNEVLDLDDLEAAGVVRSGSWFQLLRTIKNIGRKIVTFVSQIENFQKRVFEKKKLVTEVHYCVTLDRVPVELYPEIARNKAQVAEWKRLFLIHEIKKNLIRPGYTEPLKTDFLQANPFLVLDTKFFTDEFTSRLIASEQILGEAESLDEAMDGLLIHGDNFQALRLIQNRYRGTLRCIYIDPPYNTDAGPILYKNGYRSSTWMSMIENRLIEAKPFLSDDGIICVTIDDYQVHELAHLLDRVFDKSNQLGVAVIRNNPSGRSTVRGFSVCHEYAFFYRNTDAATPARLPRTEKQLDRFTQENGIHVDWRNFRKDGGLVTHRAARPKQFYPIYVEAAKKRLWIPKLSWNKNERKWEVLEKPAKDEVVVWPIDEKGKERVWSLNHLSARDHLADLEVRIAKGGDVQIFRRHIPSEGVLPRSWWDKNTYAAREYGSSALADLFGASSAFSFAKSPFAVQDSIWVAGLDAESSDCVLDFFAGSGTTAHAVINLNREDGGGRKYILVEVDDYFETVLKPRIQKVIYSKDWKDGKPVSRQGSSHAFKYLRLESYEDALDNITFQTPEKQGTFQLEDYVLNYLVNLETKESDTLLNVAKLDSPFDYTLHCHGKDKATSVDLPETFNYLIGLHVASRKAYENKGTRYVVYRGRADGRETAILWRTTRGWGQKEFEADREFVEKHKLTQGAEDIFVYSDSFLPGARSLDPVFKHGMFDEE